MTGSVEVLATRCAICDTCDNSIELYPSNFDLSALNRATFSARRLPDGIHYRMVKCTTCGLVRSDPVVNPEALPQLYAQSTFDYEAQVAGLRLTYGRYLSQLTDYGIGKGALLEIGCGNGFFLEEALAQGFKTVRGVEPSLEAVAKARPDLRPFLICDIMRPGLFEPEQFDAICMFQVFDHVPEPGVLLDECLRLLKPGGVVLCLNHNVEAMSARLLKERSPIVDIEHTYLYNPSTMSRIFAEHGYKIVDVGSAKNVCTVFYLTWLAPLPSVIKGTALAYLSTSAFGRIRLSVPLGNLYLIAQRPARREQDTTG